MMRGAVLVFLQFLFILLLLWPWGPARWPVAAALLVVASIALGIWALTVNRPGNFSIAPEVKNNARMVTAGPYAHIRHPMYSAVLLLGIGMVVLYPSLAKLVCWIFLLAVLWAKSAMEERAMRERFPGYGDYAAMVGRFFPKIMLG